MKFKMLTATALLIALAGCDNAQNSSENKPVSPPPAPSWNAKLIQVPGSSVYRTEQNWSTPAAQWFYNLSQGSRVLPYNMALALELPDSQTLFMADNLARYGYLPPLSKDQPLPVGFAKDSVQGEPDWLGLTCAACHVGQVQINGKTVQIDGAPSQADLNAYLNGVNDALKATLNDPAKLERTAKRAAGPGMSLSKLQIKKFKESVASAQQRVQDILNYAGEGAKSWGAARTDAFGMIFNRVAMHDLKIPANQVATTAPVSYPHIWDAPRFDVVQWNGIVPNQTSTDRLGRNTGEVLGVFGDAILSKPTKIGYKNTVRLPNLEAMESLLETLWAPKWTDVVGPLDDKLVAEGAALYDKNCVSCHSELKDHKSAIKTNLTLATEVGTDPTMNFNAYIADAKLLSGPMGGTKFPPLPGVTALSSPTAAGVSILTNAVGGTLFYKTINPDKNPINITGIGPTDASIQTAWSKSHNSWSAAQQAQLNKELASFTANSTAAMNPPPPVNGVIGYYKGRPLDGIWATGPYLHNGSVPNLEELLLPAAQRSKTFQVGSTKLDTAKVGFSTSEGSFTFDTRLAGNSNAGHEYGTSLNADQRRALLEYLKSL